MRKFIILIVAFILSFSIFAKSKNESYVSGNHVKKYSMKKEVKATKIKNKIIKNTTIINKTIVNKKYSNSYHNNSRNYRSNDRELDIVDVMLLNAALSNNHTTTVVQQIRPIEQIGYITQGSPIIQKQVIVQQPRNNSRVSIVVALMMILFIISGLTIYSRLRE